MAEIVLRKTREKRVQSGHPWIYQTEIERVDDPAGEIEPGDIVRVVNSKGVFVCKALYNPASMIALRVLTVRDEPTDEAFFRRRIEAAWEYRKRLCDVNSCRLIFGESDYLPALIVDKFADILVVQLLCLGMDRLRDMIVRLLVDVVKPRGIYERDDVPVREREGMKQLTGLMWGEVPDRVEMVENGIRFLVDVKHGQKTGFFLDQKENRAAIAPLCPGARVLDCFCHNGTFALNAAKYGAADVLGVDISEEALEVARENAALNGLDVRFEAHNVFDLLRQYQGEGRQFDLIVLDPPAFTKSRKMVESAKRGYKDINLRAMKLVRDGGYLVSCSCSQHVTPDMFVDILREAAYETRRRVRIIELRSQGRDHPVLLGSDETRYLKCVIMQVYS
ncbi:MAG TPA: class I SAM-dependent rRNA methyltransferase [Candidatus Fimadaptatus faecigallinarum]|uniref:Class I SAM-dependent rRNA methyltransferase n=1 Tax=Candidatus Fimadaptatus faecigallinarum TaxID=2840814 RepID=A0A9D1LT07_9FIRM|nr:class I SAM-dependent rRNA methyltransferase [Candidatus Fimadaptatus faecigallinarum]